MSYVRDMQEALGAGFENGSKFQGVNYVFDGRIGEASSAPKP